MPEHNVGLLDTEEQKVEEELAKSRPPLPVKFILNTEPPAGTTSKVPALNLGNLKHVKEYTVQKTTTITSDQLKEEQKKKD